MVDRAADPDGGGLFEALWLYATEALKRAYEQNPKAIQRWLDEDYPAIAKRAKEEGAEIHWGDEAGLRDDSQHGRSYAPCGKTPMILLSAKRQRIDLISSITNQGEVRFMAYQEKMNADVLIRFMKRLIKDADQEIFIVLDHLGVHHSKKVKAWLADHQDRIEVFYLPSYSPEINPDEYLNCDLKAGVHSRPPTRAKGDLKRKTIAHLKKGAETARQGKKVLPTSEDCLRCVMCLFDRRVNNGNCRSLPPHAPVVRAVSMAVEKRVNLVKS